jgi:predicted nucleic acid-binding protein
MVDMTRYAIDTGTAIRIATEGVPVSAGHRLVAPSLLRSQALSRLYRSVRAGESDEKEAHRVLDGITTMKIRLLGDRVSRAVAWQLAEQLGLDDTGDAEYLAVAKLQADALVASDARVGALAEGLVPTAAYEDLFRA